MPVVWRLKSVFHYGDLIASKLIMNPLGRRLPWATKGFVG